MNDMRLTERAVDTKTKISARQVQVFYDDTHAIKDVDVDILDNTVTAFIGPSGCGKSTFLRCLNRMNDTIAAARVEGDILLDGQDIYDSLVDPVQLFRHITGQVQEKLLEMFLWTTGQAAFYPNVKGPEDRFPLHIVAWELMIEGTRGRVAQGLEAEYIDGRDDDDLVRIMRVPTEIATAELPGECAMLMQLAETPRSLGALVAAIDDPMGKDRHRGVRTVLLMMRMGVLRWVDE